MPNARNQGLVDFFESMLEYHDRCAQDLGESRLDFCIAGKPVRIRFAGNSLQHLARPLAHRTPDATTGEEHPAPLENHPAPLEIFVCGGASTGMQAPLPPWQVETVSQDQMHSWRLENGDILVNHMPAYSFLCLFDCRTQRAVYWVDDVAQLPFWEIAAPFLVIFSWWAAGFGGQIAHAAAVGRSGSGLLLVGRGGSGKSTTAAACIDAGMEYVSDDYVLLTSDPDPTAHCLYSSAKLHMHVLHQHFPRWQERVSQQVGPDAKAVFFLQRSCPTQLAPCLEDLRHRAPNDHTTKRVDLGHGVQERNPAGTRTVYRVSAACPKTAWAVIPGGACSPTSVLSSGVGPGAYGCRGD